MNDIKQKLFILWAEKIAKEKRLIKYEAMAFNYLYGKLSLSEIKDLMLKDGISEEEIDKMKDKVSN